MKTTITKVMLGAIIVLFTSANAVAFEDSMKVKDNKSFDLTLTNVKNKTKITLSDTHNQILYSASVNDGENFAKAFNMELLPAGEYYLTIENPVKKTMTVLQVSEKYETAGLTATETTVFKPVVNQKGGDVYVTQFSPTQEPLYVAIYNSNNELIHEETLKGRMDLGKKFDVSKLQNGEYHFYLETNGESYSHLVNIDK